jgi:FAD/FMN-containing dehydrogenase
VDLTAFAADVGDTGPIAVVGSSSRHVIDGSTRTVRAPAGIDWLQPEEMVTSCGAGTMVAELDAALADVGQRVALPATGTVGGALAVGRSGIRRLGDGPLRDALLQAHYVSAAGEVVTAGGPTVKNVSGFDLCRLLVGSFGTLGFIGAVILRTQTRPAVSQWHTVATATPLEALTVFQALYRPTSVLWNGERTWALLEGHADDVAEQAAVASMTITDAAPPLPTGGRWSMPPADVWTLDRNEGEFVAEVGVGVVHRSMPAPPRRVDPAIASLHHRIKQQFDPRGRLNPGVDVLHV